MSTAEEVIARLEKATGSDRALDVRIFLSLFDKQVMTDGGGYAPNAKPPTYTSAREIWTDDWPYWNEPHQVEAAALELGCPHYTGSFDAAKTLVPEGRYWHAGHGRTRDDEPLGGASIIEPGTLNTISEGEAPTAELALCIAAMRAIAALKARARATDAGG